MPRRKGRDVEVIVKTYRTPEEANRDAVLMAEDGWYPQGTTGGGTGFAPIKGAAKGAVTGAAIFALTGLPPVLGFLGRKKWRAPTPVAITWVRDSPSPSRVTRETGATLCPPTTSGKVPVEYDLHNWSEEDKDNALARVKYWRIPYSWDETGDVLTVPAKYEEAMNKLVLGEN